MASQQTKAFRVLRFEMSRDVITVQREFRARFGVDVCCVAQGAHIEGLQVMHETLGQFLLLSVYVMPM
jgi:hypothetical protein